MKLGLHFLSRSSRNELTHEPSAILTVLGSFSGCVADGAEESGGVVVVEASDGVAKADGGANGEACGQLENSAFASGAGEQGRSPLFRAVMAASQSMSAIRVMPSLMLVPVWMNLLVKSSRWRNVPLTMRSATPASVV
jgi:hypothetical protein